MPYEILHHTADTGIEAIAPSLEELISEMATGMFALMADPGDAETRGGFEIGVSSPTVADLVVDALADLLFRAEVDEIIPADIRVRSKGLNDVVITGRTVDLADAEVVGPPIKAVTYHRLKVVEIETGWVGRAYFDV